jgi:phenylacetate-CoA ligase
MNLIDRTRDYLLSAQGIVFYWKLLRQSQFFPLRELEEYQFTKLRSLLTESGRYSEYYRKLFWNEGFDPARDFKSVEDLTKLPILTKSLARQNHADLSNRRKLANALPFYTSGSTGEPFLEYVSPEHWVVEQGIVWRHWKWAGYRFRDKMAIVRTFVPKKGELLWKHDHARNFLYFSAYHLTLENARKYLEVMKAWRPKFLRGYPTSLYILARMARELRMDLEGIQGIFTASETLPQNFREAIEDAFHAKIFDWYGQAEGTITLNECERHEGLHVNMEYGVCEFVPEPALGPRHFRMIATCLHNAAMPLIRYDTGDLAIVDNARCSCGRTLPLVKSILGRSDDIIQTPDLRLIPSVNFYTMFNKYLDIKAFQIIQHSLDLIEIRIQSERFSKTLQEQVERELVERIGSSVKLEFTTSVPFEQTREGKKRVIISKIKVPF